MVLPLIFCTSSTCLSNTYKNTCPNYYVTNLGLLVHNMASHGDVLNAKAQAKANSLLKGDDLVRFNDDLTKNPGLITKFNGNAELVEGWHELYKAGEKGLRTNVKALQKVTDNLEIIRKSGGYDNWKYVDVVTSSWHDAQKQLFNTALIKSKLGDKIRNASAKIDNNTGVQLYSKSERMSFEVMLWARTSVRELKDVNTWLAFAMSSELIGHFRAFRFVFAMNKPIPPINVSLGLRKQPIIDYAKPLNSTSFYHFHQNGFTTDSKFLDYKKLDKWLPIVGESVKKSLSLKGKIYFHVDGIADFRAIYDPKIPNFKGGTITEIRYLADNDLISRGLVEFRKGTQPLPQDEVNKILKAIKKYDESKEASFKGAYGINF